MEEREEIVGCEERKNKRKEKGVKGDIWKMNKKEMRSGERQDKPLIFNRRVTPSDDNQITL